jgi:hypothetical protein
MFAINSDYLIKKSYKQTFLLSLLHFFLSFICFLIKNDARMRDPDIVFNKTCLLLTMQICHVVYIKLRSFILYV